MQKSSEVKDKEMKEKISVRQICIMLVAYNVMDKLLLYPTHMAALSYSALLIPMLLNIAIQTAVVWAVAYLSSRTDKTLFQLVFDTFGQTVARVIFALFGLYFLSNAIILLSEQQLYVYDIFYDTVPNIAIFLPVFFLLVYAGSKGLQNMGRCADMCLPLFVAGLACVVAMSLSECRFDALLPMFSVPIKRIGVATLSGSFRFTHSAVIVTFLGRFKYKKGDCTKITLSNALGGAIVLLITAIYYAVYAELAPNQPFAISVLSIFFSAINLVGRVDLIALYALEIVSLFSLALYVQVCIYCLMKALNRGNRMALSFIVNGVLLVMVILFNHKFTALQAFYAKWMWIATLVFAYALPLSCLFLKKVKNEKE